MRSRHPVCSIALFFLLLIASCSGSNPVAGDLLSGSTQRTQALSTSQVLWGIYEIEWNSDLEAFEILPVRTIQFQEKVSV
ncbi:MAG TPA: hypothetical protein VGB30_04875 [bacterium]|jgi:hypothetical protein